MASAEGRTRQLAVEMRDILDSVVTRLCSLLIALAIAGAPVALEACQIVCESIPAQPAAAQHAHAHGDHHAAASHGAHHGVSTPLHHLLRDTTACDHDADAAPSVVTPRNSDGGLILAPPPRAASDVVAAGAAAVVPIRELNLPHSLGIRLASPLRV